MKPQQMPLLNVFYGIRKHGFFLGTEEYMAVLQSIISGLCISDLKSIQRLCCTVWAKSRKDCFEINRILRSLLFEQSLSSREIIQQQRYISKVVSITENKSPDKLTTQGALKTGKDRDKLGTPDTSFSIVLEGGHAVETSRDCNSEVQVPHREIRSFQFSRYAPITPREMQQIWRELRKPIREGRPQEFDVRATIELVGKRGVLLEPVLVPRFSNRSEIVFLVDWGGSMAPFHGLVEQLIRTAQHGGRFRKTHTYFFHNYPISQVFEDRGRSRAIPLSRVLELVGPGAALIIVGDAGAARGHIDEGRIKATHLAMSQIGRVLHRYVWLNPIPKHRWGGTSAGKIGRCVPMFEMSRFGIQTAVRVLRGSYLFPKALQ